MTSSDSALAMWTGIAATLAAGLLLIALSIPLISEKIGPNRLYGFRTAKTLARPEVWYAANSIAGRDLLIAGAVVVIGDLVLLILALFSFNLPTPLMSVGLLLLALTVAVAHSSWGIWKM